MLNFTIRLARDEDYAALARLRRQTIRHVNAADYPDAVIQNWANGKNAQDFRKTAMRCKRWVALDKDKIIGFCEHNLECEITRIYTHKNYLQKGISSKLLAAAETSLIKSGCTMIRVESTITAKNFYEKNGYKFVRKTAHGDNQSIVYEMIKKIVRVKG